MRWWRDTRTRVQSGLFHPQRFSSSEVRSARKSPALGVSCASSTVRGHLMIQRTRFSILQLSNQTYSCPCSVLFCSVLNSKASSRCELGFDRSWPRDGFCMLRRCIVSLLPFASVVPQVPPFLEPQRPRLADARLCWVRSEKRAPQYLSSHVTQVARNTLFGTTRRWTRPLLYIGELDPPPYVPYPILFRPLPALHVAYLSRIYFPSPGLSQASKYSRSFILLHLRVRRLSPQAKRP